jgi:hypothetical protein
MNNERAAAVRAGLVVGRDRGAAELFGARRAEPVVRRSTSRAIALKLHDAVARMASEDFCAA